MFQELITPEANSASTSVKSKGVRFVSANMSRPFHYFEDYNLYFQCYFLIVIFLRVRKAACSLRDKQYFPDFTFEFPLLLHQVDTDQMNELFSDTRSVHAWGPLKNIFQV